MKNVAIVGAVLCVMLGMGWSAFGQVSLDGKSYAGKLASAKDGKTYDEKIIFGDGKIRSTACEAQGFKGGAYTVTEKDGVTTVKGSVMNEKGEKNEIEATVKGDKLTGTLTAKMADGTVGDTMTLTAALEKKPKKTEHPSHMEHPSAEHPK